MEEELTQAYKDIKQLEILIDKFAYSKDVHKNKISIHIEEVRNWLLRVECIKYSLATSLNIDDDFGNDYECPLCSSIENTK